MHWTEATRILVFNVPPGVNIEYSQEVVYNFKPDFTWQCMPQRLPCYTKLMLNSSSSYLLSQAQAQKPEQSHNKLR